MLLCDAALRPQGVQAGGHEQGRLYGQGIVRVHPDEEWMLLSQGIILGADLPLFDGVKEDAQEQHGYHNTDRRWR